MPRPPLRISSELSLETRRGALAGKRWMDLLAAIGDSESITAAAKLVGLSYKAAWDAVEAMNNLSDKPLVSRSVGGRGGGGTVLTPRGQQLVATFRNVEIENARFVERINRGIATAGADLHLIGRLGMLTSARNHFAGTVTRISTGSVNDEVELELSGGDRLIAIITHASVEQLGLAVGGAAIALIKASSILLAVAGDTPMRLSARNQLAGTILRIEPGAVNTEVVIALGGGNSVAAVITNASAKTLALAEGQKATAVFKASSVILAVSG